eukprot:jgi/Chlat1/6643/Chrsp49S06143
MPRFKGGKGGGGDGASPAANKGKGKKQGPGPASSSDVRRRGAGTKDAKDAGDKNKQLRTAATVRRLAMYRSRPKRDSKGKVLKWDLQSRELPSTRIQPDRRWFGNTRVVGQRELERFREEVGAKAADPYTVLVKEKKLPLSLLQDHAKQSRVHLLDTEPYAHVFGKKQLRKRPRLSAEGYEELISHATANSETYQTKKEAPAEAGTKTIADDQPDDGMRSEARDTLFNKGQSKRIWGELYKVLDSSDVVIQVLDARDPEGTRCRYLEKHLRNNARHKHLILLLNKVDLVPAWVTRGWLQALSKEYPTLAFHASVTKPFGKGSLLSLLRQLARIKSSGEGRPISVGFVGYPNVGKSSVINTLRTKEVCKVAPVPGETKVWQYITLMKRIFLIDCPGVVYQSHDTDTDIVLKGVVRIGNLDDATEYVKGVLDRVKREYLTRAYKISQWETTEEFLSQLARQAGKLMKGGEPDLNTAAKMILYDWQRGRIPYFKAPPRDDAEPASLPSEAPASVAEEPTKAPEDAAADAAIANLATELVKKQSKKQMPKLNDYYDADDLKASASDADEEAEAAPTDSEADEGDEGDDCSEDADDNADRQADDGAGEDDVPGPSNRAGDSEDELTWEEAVQGAQVGMAGASLPAAPVPAVSSRKGKVVGEDTSKQGGRKRKMTGSSSAHMASKDTLQQGPRKRKLAEGVATGKGAGRQNRKKISAKQ